MKQMTINNEKTMIKEEAAMMNVMMTEVMNLERVMKGEFGGVPMTQAEEIRRMSQAVKNDNRLYMDAEGNVRTSDDRGNKPEEGNCGEIKPGTFAARQYDQWYERNRLIYEGEIAEMKKRYPSAKMGFLEMGNMYWVVNLHMSKTGAIKPYTVMLKYEKNHPSNDSYGGSIRCILLSPTVEELEIRAKNAGRRGVPHLLKETENGDSFTYLCTRLPDEVAVGKTNLSAAQAVGYAADWILAYELGLRDKQIWNHKFCGPNHTECWVA